jgi:hypothetical protein
LYPPTAVAAGYLAWLSAVGTFPELKSEMPPYPEVILARLAVMVVWFLLTAWVHERWLLRSAEAVTLHSVRRHGDRVGPWHYFSYVFVLKGEFYGGTNIPLFSYRDSSTLASVVMFRRNRPQSSRMVTAFLFHKFEIAAHGVQDMHEARKLAAEAGTAAPAESQ